MGRGRPRGAGLNRSKGHLERESLEPGSLFLRRYVRGPYLSWVQAARVVGDDEHGLLLAVPDGTGFACRVDADGAPQREAPMAEVAAAPLVERGWRGNSVLILVRPGRAHSVWWVFRDGRFVEWYVNLETPARFWSAPDGSRCAGLRGLDVTDHGLDIVVPPDRRWRWKDEDDFAAYTGEPGYWSADEADAIRAEAHTVIAQIDAGAFPFDGTWCDGFPPVEPTRLPAGWDTSPVS